MKKADAVIIGFGKGGKTLAETLAKAGKQVILVERWSKMYGGTCINVACIPTKSLVHSAALSAEKGGSFIQRAERYQAAIEEKDRLTAMLRNKNYHKLADNPNITVITGDASFLDGNHIEVTLKNGKETLEADQIFINTGASPFIPPIPGLAQSKRVYLSESLMNLKELPLRLLVIGGGYIGVEFASMYANFGSQVTILQDTETFLPREDEEVAKEVWRTMKERGIEILPSATVKRVDDEKDETAVTVETKEGERILSVEAVLVATGRRPNVEGLNLEHAGVELTLRGGIKTDEHLQTTAPNIWAMGDVAGGLQFTYISLDDYRIVKSQLFSDGSRTTNNRGAVPYSVFLDPPFSRIGLTQAEAVRQGYEVKAVTLAAAAVPKAQVLGKTFGLLKAVIDVKTEKILGVHLFCEESHEMINIVKLAMDADLSYTALRDSIYTHPTMSESLNQLLDF